MGLQDLLQRVLFFFGVGFFIANVLIFVDLVRFRIRMRSALLVWQGEKPRFYGFSLALGVMLGLLFVFKLFVQQRPLNTLLGESMMFVYYGYALPLSTRIARGFYKDGIWSDTGFMRWAQISAVSWKEEGSVTLILTCDASASEGPALRLTLPPPGEYLTALSMSSSRDCRR